MESAAGTAASSSAPLASRRPPAAPAQIAARWLLPDPSGPTRAIVRAGQCGQLSTSARAAALPGPTQEILARKILPGIEREGKLAWRGVGQAHHAGSLPEQDARAHPSSSAALMWTTHSRT